MAIHLTPTELAREAGLERREVIEKCMEMGVPIFQGRIDKTLFLANLSEQAASPSRSPQRSTGLTQRQLPIESASSGSKRRSHGEQHRGQRPMNGRPVRRRSPT